MYSSEIVLNLTNDPARIKFYTHLPKPPLTPLNLIPTPPFWWPTGLYYINP